MTKPCKRIPALILAVLLLGGCGPAPEAEETAPAVTAPVKTEEAVAAVTEPAQTEEAMPAVTEPAQTEEAVPAVTEPAQTEPAAALPEPAEETFVRVADWIPGAVVELRYATEQNFTGQPVYDFSGLWLRYGTVKKLMAVQTALEQQGLGLKFWDGFRPVAAQFRLWEICPDPTFVANPQKGFSSHSRGNTVDLTLVTADGTELPMPTGFDDFSALADRDYSDCPPQAAENARLLEKIMEAEGFRGYRGEWWHFTDTRDYAVAEDFAPIAPRQYRAECREFISLRLDPDVAAEVITTIPAGGEFTVTAVCADFLAAQYDGFAGFVLAAYASPVPEELQ